MRYFMILPAATLALWCGPAGAQTDTGFSVGLDVTDYSYRERDAGTTVVFDDGVMTGLDFGYTARLGSDVFLRTRVAARYGKIDYRDDTGDRIENVEQSVGLFDVHVVKDVKLSPSATLSPYIGLGTRVLEDESGGRTSVGGGAGYDRKIDYFYAPIGSRLSFGTSAKRNVTLFAEFDYVLRSRVHTELSDIDPVLPDISLKGRGGHGVQLGAAVVRPFGGHTISFGPFFRRWSLAQSHVLTFTEPAGTVTFVEPKNRTSEWGMRIGVDF